MSISTSLPNQGMYHMDNNSIESNEASFTLDASQMRPYSSNINQAEQELQPHEFIDTLTDQIESMNSYSIDKCILQRDQTFQFLIHNMLKF